MSKKSILTIFNISVILYSIYIIMFSFHMLDPAVIRHILFKPDAYINYSGGSMRRGLDGHLIYLICLNVHCTPWKIQVIYAAITILVFIFLLIFCILKFKIPLIPLFSMSCLLCLIWYSKTGIRKDYIILSFYILYLLYLKKNWLKNKIFTLIVLNLIYVISILIHEISFIFFISPIFVFLLLQNGWKLNKKLVLDSFTLFTIPLLVFILCALIRPGNAIIEAKIIESWQPLGISKITFYTGIFREPYYIWKFATSELSYLLILLAFLFHFIFVFLSTTEKIINVKAIKVFKIVLITQFILAILLSIIASDISRWIIFASFTSIFFIFINKELIKDFSVKKANNFQYIYVLQYYFLTIPFSTEAGIENYFKSLPLGHIIDFLIK